jgi:hypothetical protein
MVETRIALRYRVVKAGTIKFGSSSINCMVRNLSTTGAALGVQPDRHPCEIHIVPRDGLYLPCKLCGVADTGSAWHSIRSPHLAATTHNLFINHADPVLKAAFWCSIYQAAVGPDSPRWLFVALSVDELKLAALCRDIRRRAPWFQSAGRSRPRWGSCGRFSGVISANLRVSFMVAQPANGPEWVPPILCRRTEVRKS